MDIVSKQIKDYSIDGIEKDYEKLTVNKSFAAGSTVGNKVVDFFTFAERLNTTSRKGISFHEFLDNINSFRDKHYFIQFMNNNCNKNTTSKLYRFYNLYFGSVTIFKPLNAMIVYNKYKPNSVLDFTMGWGGRLVGACASNIGKYIGIDSNTRLEEPYQKMTSFLEQRSTTTIDLHFCDSLDVDYSKLDYDLVLTSPPYYNIEIYGDEIIPYQTREEWNEQFYTPIFERTFRYLKKGGKYCLNVPPVIYNDVCVPLLGEADEFIPLPITKRNQTSKYHEFIYVWAK